jgi:hypothetical protein
VNAEKKFPPLDHMTARSLRVLDDLPIPDGHEGDVYINAYRHLSATVRRQAERIRDNEAELDDLLRAIASLPVPLPIHPDGIDARAVMDLNNVVDALRTRLRERIRHAITRRT